MTGWSAWSLPNLNELSEYDDRLRQVVTDEQQVKASIQRVLLDLDQWDDRALISLSGWLADAYRILGDYDEALRWGRMSLARASSISTEGNVAQQVAASIRLAEVYRSLDQFQEAEDHLLRALVLIDSDQTADRYRHFAHQHLGKLYLDWRRLTDARLHLEEAACLRILLSDEQLQSSVDRALDRLEHLEKLDNEA